MITDQSFLKEIDVDGLPFIVEAKAGKTFVNKITCPCICLYAELKMQSSRAIFRTASVQQGINESIASLEQRLVDEIKEKIKNNKLEFDLYRELFKNGYK